MNHKKSPNTRGFLITFETSFARTNDVFFWHPANWDNLSLTFNDVNHGNNYRFGFSVLDCVRSQKIIKSDLVIIFLVFKNIANCKRLALSFFIIFDVTIKYIFMIKREIIFKDYDLARPLLVGIKTTYRVDLGLNRYGEKGLLLTFEIRPENLDEYLELIESFGLETY